MKIINQEGWDKHRAANPLPGGWSEDPSSWPPYNNSTTDFSLTSENNKIMERLYGAVCWVVAERWADLMEKKLSEGVPIQDCARETFSKADQSLGSWGGVSGFQYGCIVSILAQVWEHGEELRRWHNLDTQLGHEGEKANETGGVLNPALLNIGR